MILNIYYWEKRTFSKLVGKINSSERVLLNCFAREIKSFYQSSLGNGVGFREIMNGSPNILATSKFQKTETRFCRWKSTDNSEINMFLFLENPCTFLLAKEKTWQYIFNTNSELSELSKNRTEKQIIPFKITINWLPNDIWCYLVTGWFNWKIRVFLQTVPKGLLYP